VLNPNIKDVYFKSHWGAAKYKKGMKGLEETVHDFVPISATTENLQFDQYYAAGEANKFVEITAATAAVAAAAPLHRYSSSFLLDAVQSVKQTEHAKANPCNELKVYFSSPLEQVNNILHHWGVLYVTG
jgi:hypothetical protein